MTVRLAQWTIDVADTERAWRFWSAALGYDVHAGDDGHAWLVPRGSAAGTEPTVWLQNTSGGHEPCRKNPVHPDLAVVEGSAVDAEVDRLLGLGATRADVGQTGSERFVVLRDPDGNEFCVLRRYDTSDHSQGMTAALIDACDAYLLDVDGTLVDSNYHHVLAWQRAFRAHGLVVPTAQIHSWVGMGGDLLVPTVAGEEFEAEHGDSTRAAWREVFDARLDEVVTLPGASGLVRALADTGRPVVLASSAPRPHIERYLRQLDVAEAVAAWTTSEDVATTKPAPDLLVVATDRVGAQRPLVIGDSPWDCRAAQHADLPCAAVRAGGFTTDQLRASGAAAVYSTLVDLTAAVRRSAD